MVTDAPLLKREVAVLWMIRFSRARVTSHRRRGRCA